MAKKPYIRVGVDYDKLTLRDIVITAVMTILIVGAVTLLIGH
jgi:hypothetical protein